MNNNKGLKLLFIINPGSGNNSVDHSAAIQQYFSSLPHSIELYTMPTQISPQKIAEKIKQSAPDKVIAVGGDGTVKLVATALVKTNIPLGILPAGSANGMAKELGIPLSAQEALNVVVNGECKKIHMVYINNQLCIHLSDIGFNAFVVQKFETLQKRGMWGYVKAAWQVLKSNPRMQVSIHNGEDYIQREAAMVVIANATKYGTGVVINPKGRLDDELFEVIIVKEISLSEILKMRFIHSPFDTSKTELLQTAAIKIESKHKVHFQVDGEYFGKVNNVTATILPAAVQVIVPL